MFKPGLCDKKQELREWYYSDRGGFWCANPHFILEEVKHFDSQKAWGSRTIIIEEGKTPKEYITWDNYFTEGDIKECLSNHGFDVLSINTELVAENEFTSNDVMFIEAKRRI